MVVDVQYQICGGRTVAMALQQDTTVISFKLIVCHPPVANEGIADGCTCSTKRIILSSFLIWMSVPNQLFYIVNSCASVPC